MLAIRLHPLPNTFIHWPRTTPVLSATFNSVPNCIITTNMLILSRRSEMAFYQRLALMLELLFAL
jgi:hypothetical protein